MISEKITTLYGYAPSLVASGFFIAAFVILTLGHIYLVGRTRIWFLSIIVVGGFSEIAGWIGRAFSHDAPAKLNPFLVQQICLILAPCFFSAFIYGISGLLIATLGGQYSRLRPTLYMWIFCICDLIAIVIQAVGGAMAALALEKGEQSQNGTHIMVAGIVFQLVSMVVFCALILDFYLKARHDPSYGDRTGVDQGRIQRLLTGIFIGSGLILLRCIYRTAELAQGWTGYLITHEGYFIGLDSVPMVLTMAVFLWAHPSWCLPNYVKKQVSAQTSEAAGSFTSSSDEEEKNEERRPSDFSTMSDRTLFNEPSPKVKEGKKLDSVPERMAEKEI